MEQGVAPFFILYGQYANVHEKYTVIFIAMKAERAVRKVILEQPALNTKVFSTSVFSPSSLSTEIFIFTVTATNLNGGKLELKDIRRVTYYSWGFKYHITNKGKNKPFPGGG